MPQVMRSWSAAARVSPILLITLLLSLAGQAAAQGKGGGKPPKDPPPDFQPTLVYQRNGNIIVADEAAQTHIAVHSLGGVGGTPAWSPDGREIVFVDALFDANADCVPGWALIVLDVSEALAGRPFPRCLVNLNGQSIEVNSPVWSVNGIVYSDREVPGGDNWELFIIVDPDAVEPASVRLTTTPNVAEESPSWSPLADRLVYVQRTFGYDSDSDLMVVDFLPGPPPGLTTPTVLLTDTDLGGNGLIDVPDWSNGHSLIAVLAANPEGTTLGSVWILDADNPSYRENVTAGLQFGFSLPSWSADDTEIVITSDVENLCTFKARDKNKSQLAIMPATGVGSPACVDAFIGPAGTFFQDSAPRSLDWYPGPTSP